MLSVQIKKIALKEAEELQMISRATFFDAYAPFNTPENVNLYLEVSFGLEQLKRELQDPNSEFYFAFLDSTPVGYLKINFNSAQTVEGYPNSTEIERIYVSKEVQGKNIGSLLIEKAKAIARNKKHDLVWLGVWVNNFVAIEFYKKLGFEIFGEHPFLFGEDKQTDHLMKIAI